MGGYPWGNDGTVKMDIFNGEVSPSPINTYALCMSATIRQSE